MEAGRLQICACGRFIKNSMSDGQTGHWVDRGFTWNWKMYNIAANCTGYNSFSLTEPPVLDAIFSKFDSFVSLWDKSSKRVIKFHMWLSTLSFVQVCIHSAVQILVLKFIYIGFMNWFLP